MRQEMTKLRKSQPMVQKSELSYSTIAGETYRFEVQAVDLDGNRTYQRTLLLAAKQGSTIL
jgi:hypothetical protein